MSKNKKQLLELIICSVLYVICIIVFHFVNLPNNLWFIELIAYLLLYLASSYKVIIKACKNIVRGKILDENFLMLVASIAAFAIKDYKEAINSSYETTFTSLQWAMCSDCIGSKQGLCNISSSIIDEILMSLLIKHP